MTDFPLSDVVGALERENIFVQVNGALPEFASNITDDSRRVKPGTLFIALAGVARDGHEFISSARKAGAPAVLCEHAVDDPVPQIIVKNGRRAAGVAAAVAYRYPAAALSLTGVTGTNGKTTTAGMLRHLMDETIARSASIGTVGVLIGSEGEPLEGGDDLTTPGPVELQRVLRSLVDSHVRRVAMEVSSHSLDQRRVDGLEFQAAIFTNLTRDHLDYHGTMEHYREAKARLLEYLKPGGVVVVNVDDAAWDSLPIHGTPVRFGIRKKADIMARSIVLTAAGSRWELCAGAKCHPVTLPMLGDFNVMNALGAAAAMWGLGKPLSEIAEKLSNAPQVPGRLEIISRTPAVIRDYAHTPDALERALRALRPITAGRLICVFGCGGDRDKGKRPLMGRAAEELADISVVTSDNPRTEPPETIIDDIVAGMKTKNHERIADRHDAIARALSIASSDDVVLLAGKGHETYQIRGTEKFPFDEKLIVALLTGAAQ
ncbi:MAG: UDP-N-acetylmuramoyl-L-alanyl-D-glutamate--2,6-diaminopimelate ligase [Gemmatimonadaceae bacterium]|nr:UDP-N-acetylmuramoyl-L-alanyl-D-glutamate--2,6-diaminopimelate ligase [Gemmatimonadaceae bacterium]